MRGIKPGNADQEIPSLLRDLVGDDRKLAARRAIEVLGKTLKEAKRKGKEWVAPLLAAAEGP